MCFGLIVVYMVHIGIYHIIAYCGWELFQFQIKFSFPFLRATDLCLSLLIYENSYIFYSHARRGYIRTRTRRMTAPSTLLTNCESIVQGTRVF